MLSSLEKRALIWLAHQLPSGVSSDHLTILGFVSLLAVGLSYWYARFSTLGLALSGYMSERVAVGLLVAYFLLSIEVYLATYTVGKFHLSFAAFSPTELRLLLIIGNIALLSKPLVTIAGRQYLLFDVGGAIGIAGMGLALLWSIVKHTRHLYRAEALS